MLKVCWHLKSALCPCCANMFIHLIHFQIWWYVCKEYVASLIGLYKTNGPVSCVTIHFLFIWSLYLARTLLIMSRFAWNEKQYLSWVNPGLFIILWERWHHQFILVNGDIFLLVLHYLARPRHGFCHIGQEVFIVLKIILIKEDVPGSGPV